MTPRKRYENPRQAHDSKHRILRIIYLISNSTHTKISNKHVAYNRIIESRIDSKSSHKFLCDRCLILAAAAATAAPIARYEKQEKKHKIPSLQHKQHESFSESESGSKVRFAWTINRFENVVDGFTHLSEVVAPETVRNYYNNVAENLANVMEIKPAVVIALCELLWKDEFEFDVGSLAHSGSNKHSFIIPCRRL